MAWIFDTSWRPEDRAPISVSEDEIQRFLELARVTTETARGSMPRVYLVVPVTPDYGLRYPDLERPFTAKLKRRVGSLPHRFRLPFGPIISEEFRELIEKFEPGIHNFMPLELNGSGGLVRNDYSILNICTRLDTIVIESSPSLDCRITSEQSAELYSMKKPDIKTGGVVSSRRIIASYHLWFEYKLREVMISNPLADELLSAGIIKRHDDPLDYLYPVQEI